MDPYQQLSAPERYHIIEEDLARSNIYPNDIYTRNEFYELLDSRLHGQTFDRSIALQLYERMDKDGSGRIQINEFMRVFIEAQDFLIQNLVQTLGNLREYEMQRVDAIEKIEALRHEEVLNAHGIMEGSMLTMQVLELRGVERAMYRDVFFEVTCGDNTFQSETLPYSDGMEWNDQFNMDIKTGMENVHMALIAYNSSNEAEILGELVIEVKFLSDQLYRDQEFEFEDHNGERIGGTVHLKLQWIHSRIKYLENLISKWEENIQGQIDDKEDFEQSLASLNELFPRLYRQSAPHINLEQSGSIHQQQHQQQYEPEHMDHMEHEEPADPHRGTGTQERMKSVIERDSSGHDSYHNPHVSAPRERKLMANLPQNQSNNQSYNEIMQGGFQPDSSDMRILPSKSDLLRFSQQASKTNLSADIIPRSTQTLQQQSSQPHIQQPVARGATQQLQQQSDGAMSWQDIGTWGQMSFIGTLVMMFLTLFSCFMKASYLELVICFGLLKDYDLAKRFRGTGRDMIKLMGVLAVAICWDLLWLVIYTSRGGSDMLGWEPMNTTLIFVLVIEYFSLLLKFGLMFAYFNFYTVLGHRPVRLILAD